MADFRSSVKHPHLLIFLGGMGSGGSKKQTLPYLFVIIAVFQLTVIVCCSKPLLWNPGMYMRLLLCDKDLLLHFIDRCYEVRVCHIQLIRSIIIWTMNEWLNENVGSRRGRNAFLLQCQLECYSNQHNYNVSIPSGLW